jgi:hypothetical protein
MSQAKRQRVTDKETVPEISSMDRLKACMKSKMPRYFKSPFAYFRSIIGCPDKILQGSMIQAIPTSLFSTSPIGGFRFSDHLQKELFFENLPIVGETVIDCRNLFYAAEHGFNCVIKTNDGYLVGGYRSVCNDYLVGRGQAVKIISPENAHVFMEILISVLTEERIETMNRTSTMELSNLLFAVMYRSNEDLTMASDELKAMVDAKTAIDYLLKKDTEFPEALRKRRHQIGLLNAVATLISGNESPLDLLNTLEKADMPRKDIIRFLALTTDTNLPYRRNGNVKHYNKDGVILETVMLNTVKPSDLIFTTKSHVTIAELHRIKDDIQVFTEMPYRLSSKSTKKREERLNLNEDPVDGEMRDAEYFLRLCELNRDVIISKKSAAAAVVEFATDAENADEAEEVDRVNPFNL